MELTAGLLFASISSVLLVAILCKKALLAVVATERHRKWFTAFELNFMKYGVFQELIEPAKRKIFSHLAKSLEKEEGDVLEIGIGGGSNFRFYPPGTSLIGVDPNPFAEELLQETLKQGSWDVHLKSFILGSSEDMRPKEATGIPDQSVAAVVCTFVLCSMTVSQVRDTLREVKRVLKPGGKFFFLEHVLDTSGSLRSYIQQLLEASGLWTAIFYGCHLNRQTSFFLEEAGFKNLCYDTVSFKLPAHLWLQPCNAIVVYTVASTISGWAEV